MGYILKFIPSFKNSAHLKNLNCMSAKKVICNKSVYDSEAIENSIKRAAKTKQILDNENTQRANIIKESAAAKAYLGLR